MDERRCVAYINISCKRILGPHLEPVEKISYWSEMVMDPSGEFHVFYPVRYRCEIDGYLNSSRSGIYTEMYILSIMFDKSPAKILLASDSSIENFT